MSPKEQTHGDDKENAKQRSPKSATENLDILVQQQTHSATIIQRARIDPRSLTLRDLLQLQRTIGNQAVGRLLAGRVAQASLPRGRAGPPGSTIQAKLTVGPAGDQYEQEADQVAEQVLSMPAPVSDQPSVQRAGEEEEELQTKPLAASITPLVQRATPFVTQVLQKRRHERPLPPPSTTLIQRECRDLAAHATGSTVTNQCHAAVMNWLRVAGFITNTQYQNWQMSDRATIANQVFFGNGKVHVAAGPPIDIPAGRIVGFFQGPEGEPDSFLQHTMVSLGGAILAGVRNTSYGKSDGYDTLNLNQEMQWVNTTDGPKMARNVANTNERVSVYYQDPANINRDAIPAPPAPVQAPPAPTGKCYITTACVIAKGLPDDCDELTTLRSFRDGYMQSLKDGDFLINEYYRTAPLIVEKIKAQTNAKEIFEDLYAVIVRCVNLIKSGEGERALKEYTDMVLKLKARYL